MKKEMVMWLIVAVLVVGLLLGTQKAETMAISFDTAGDRVEFDTDAIYNLTQKTIVGTINANGLDSFENTAVAGFIISFFNSSGYGVGVEDNAVYGNVNALYFFQTTTVQTGAWTSPQNSIAAGGEIAFAISYDKGSTSNDPIFYINGAPVATTEISAPTGSFTETNTANAIIGTINDGGYYTFDGIIRDIRIYNRILTAAEIAQIYSARGRDNIRNGLVFCPFLNGAAGLQVFDGATLAAGNTIVDPCSGAVGVPAGNPVGVGETYLR